MSVEEKILKQIEFYFSDSNLPNDRFLKSEIEKNEGWVALATLASFQRLKSLSTDLSVIADALKTSTLVELNEDKTKIKRSSDVEDVVDNTPSTVFISTFPYTSTLDSLEEFLTGNQVDFKCIRLRYHRSRDGGRSFRGSILVELKSPEDVKALVARVIAAPGSKTEENLVIKSYEDFDLENKQKEAERESVRQKAEQDRLAKELKDQESLQRFQPTPFETGHLISFTGMPATGARENINKLCQEAGLQVAFIDYDRGRPSGAVRLDNDAKDITTICESLNKAAAAIDAENPPVFSVLADEAEKVEWDVIERLKEERLMASKNDDRNKRGKSRFNPRNNKKFFNKKSRR